MATSPRSFTALTLMAGAALLVGGCSSRGRDLPTGIAPASLTQIGVNAYLWRAAVDTLSFAPLLQADSNGGVVVTDWYVNPKAPGERVKVTASILDQELRADALKIAVARQVNQGGTWVDAPVAAATVQKLEDVILTRARDLRRGTIAPRTSSRKRG